MLPVNAVANQFRCPCRRPGVASYAQSASLNPSGGLTLGLCVEQGGLPRLTPWLGSEGLMYERPAQSVPGFGCTPAAVSPPPFGLNGGPFGAEPRRGKTDPPPPPPAPPVAGGRAVLDVQRHPRGASV